MGGSSKSYLPEKLKESEGSKKLPSLILNNYLKLVGIGNEPNIPTALVIELMAAWIGATAASAPVMTANKASTVFKVAITGVNTPITKRDIMFPFNKTYFLFTF